MKKQSKKKSGEDAALDKSKSNNIHVVRRKIEDILSERERKKLLGL